MAKQDVASTGFSRRSIPWTAGKDRLSLSCCARKRFGCHYGSIAATGFDIRRRYQMPDNVEPFQPEDGPHRGQQAGVTRGCKVLGVNPIW